MANNEITIDDVLDSVARYQTIAGENESAMNQAMEAGNRSWDYSGHAEREQNEAREKAKNALDGYIDQRVRAILAEHAAS